MGKYLDQYVFVVESGDYEQRAICGVADSLDAAVAIITKPYGAPYIVKWDAPVKQDDDQWELVGHFTRVEGFCGDGPTNWPITRYHVTSAAPAPSPGAKRCGVCHKCLEGQTASIGPLTVPVTSTCMILCETCGNKRCPHATDCALACTNSNELGQPGSIYTGGTWNPNETPEDLAARLKKIDAFVAECNASPGADGLKKPRLFYWEDAENCWCPADGLTVDDIITAEFFMRDGDIEEIRFKRIDMTDEEFNAIPES